MSKRPPERKSRIGLVAAVAVLSVAAAGLAHRFWPEEIELPALDFEEMEPPVAEKIRSHADAVREAPESHEAWGGLGVVLQAHGLDEESAECYARALEIAPETFRWRYLHVHALRAFDAPRALEESARALETDDGYSPLHVIHGELLEGVDRPEEALGHYEKALELDPESGVAAFSAGRLRFAQGDLDEALELLSRASSLDPEAGAIQASLAQVHRRRGDRDLAMEAARLARERTAPVAVPDSLHFQMRQESVSSIAQLSRAQAASEVGDHRRAERLYRDLVALRPDDADMHARLGDTLMELGRTAEARQSYEKALGVDADHAWGHYGLGNVASFDERYDHAVTSYRRSIELRDDHAQVRVNLGSVLAYQGRVDEAIAMIESAVEIDPRSFDARRALGEALIRRRDAAGAVEHLQAAADIRPDAPAVRFQLSMALAQTGSFDRALEHLLAAERLGHAIDPGLRQEIETRAGAR